MSQITYMIREDSPFQFTVSKWDGGIMPLCTYTVKKLHNGKTSCSCPSGTYRGYCHHKDMVSKWIKLDKPMVEFTK